MRHALFTTAATAVFVLYSQGVFSQATAPAQPDPATSAPPAGAATSTAPAPVATPPTPSPAPGEPIVSAPPPAPAKQMSVSDLTEKDLQGSKEDEIGDIERVVEANSDKKQYLVISRGGFLGLFESEVLVPLENVAVQGDRIVLRNMTEEQIKASPKFENDDKAYRELEGSTTVNLSEMK